MLTIISSNIKDIITIIELNKNINTNILFKILNLTPNKPKLHNIRSRFVNRPPQHLDYVEDLLLC